MMLSTATQIIKTIEQYNKFAECLLLEINWTNYGTTAELVFNYVWTDEGKIRSHLEQEERVILKFKLVQEFHLKNAISDAILAQPERLNWGINEIALVEIEDNDEFLKNYRALSIPVHHAAILWEDERRIDIVFGELEVANRVHCPPSVGQSFSFATPQLQSGEIGG